jgi:hypothetical protein
MSAYFVFTAKKKLLLSDFFAPVRGTIDDTWFIQKVKSGSG